MALKAKFEGILNPFFKIDETAYAGQVAMLDDSKEGFVKVSDGTEAYGFLAQDVLDVPEDKYRPLVGELAYKGGLVGVYTDGGVYYTDQYVGGTYKPGDPLYVTSGGKLTNLHSETVSATEGNLQVGVVEELDGRGLRFKSLI